MQRKLDFYKNEKIKFEKRNLQVEKELQEKNEEIKKLNTILENNNIEFAKLNSKHNGLLLYASDLQKKVENLDIELLERTQEINKFKSTDWGKLLHERDQLIKILQNDLVFYKSELNKIKTTLGFSNTGNTKANPLELASRVDNLIDNYIVENKKFKRIVIILYSDINNIYNK